MLKRVLSDKLIEFSRKFPVITITGPRQSGKTTLVKAAFDRHTYVSLEDPDEREFATNDPKGFLKRFKKGVILDEVQKAPRILSYIQGIVDAEDLPGRFILTGSQQIHLLHKISQTLAGRTAVIHLLPFSISELTGRKPMNPYKFDTYTETREMPSNNLETILYQGLYPRIHDKGLDAHDWSSHIGEIPPLYFWRDRTGHEVDIIIDTGKKLIPVEIKSGETIVDESFEGLRYYTSLKGNVTKTGVLVYPGDKSYRRNHFIVKRWYECS